ncbi:hypothetical protein A2160_01805 [Candidatus Beckwithbacteria bacterium RBG_13_42_9]|uniref:Uncharacterized protein n=1 Tax=Candidatus Beckwithbacteria bacterium RBG_13_42_9 TaxID=1797457 RepID=A0A1F5E855_9BACT|nr:MAG: hypothetical protein A2160_01805 [Candidatus Beckwithbacteria bacterium RBG_13_42_9]
MSVLEILEVADVKVRNALNAVVGWEVRQAQHVLLDPGFAQASAALDQIKETGGTVVLRDAQAMTVILADRLADSNVFDLEMLAGATAERYTVTFLDSSSQVIASLSRPREDNSWLDLYF